MTTTAAAFKATAAQSRQALQDEIASAKLKALYSFMKECDAVYNADLVVDRNIKKLAAAYGQLNLDKDLAHVPTSLNLHDVQ